MTEPRETFGLGICRFLEASDPGTFALTRVTADLQELADRYAAVHWVRRAGGLTGSWQAHPRIVVETHANRDADVWKHSDRAQDALLEVPYWIPDGDEPKGVLIDKCVQESAPAELEHPNLRVVTATYVLTTRGL